MMNSDGSDQQQLTNGKSDNSASWSPDGKQIAFTSGDDGQLYLINANGSQLLRLTENLGSTFDPT